MQFFLIEENATVEIDSLKDYFVMLCGKKGISFTKQIKITDENVFNKIFITLTNSSDSSKLKPVNSYYKINDCLGINFTIEDTTKILYGDSIVINNNSNECIITIKVIFLQDNYLGKEYEDITDIEFVII